MSQENQATTYGNAAQAGYATIPQGGLPQYTEAWALIEAARRMAEATAAIGGSSAARRGRWAGEAHGPRSSAKGCHV